MLDPKEASAKRLALNGDPDLMVHGVQMVGLFVADLESAVEFYRDVLGIPLQVDAYGAHHHADYFFRDPYFHFALFPAAAGRPIGRAHVTFRVDDCREAFHRRRGQTR